MHEAKWTITMTNKTEYMVDSKVKANIVRLIQQGAKFIEIDHAVINPSYIVSMDEEESMGYGRRLYSGGQTSNTDEPRANQSTLDKIRDMLKHKAIGGIA